MEWSNACRSSDRCLKEKLHVFDRPLALWQQLQIMLGGSGSRCAVPDAEIRLGPARRIEFLSPTFTEFLLFFATLILFIASWKDLRRALDHDLRRSCVAAADAADSQRDRGASRRLPADRDDDQSRRRRRHRHHLRGDRHAQSGRARRAGRDPEFPSHHRPGRDVRDADGGRDRRLSDPRRAG